MAWVSTSVLVYEVVRLRAQGRAIDTFETVFLTDEWASEAIFKHCAVAILGKCVAQ